MPSRVDALPETLGRYQVLAPIASGGMARVYVGRVLGEGGFERLVALKCMLPELADDPKFVDMFLDEGRIAGLVTSPHVVQVLDVARASDGNLFMVLDLVRGVPLHTILRAALVRRVRLEVPVLVGILAQAAEGLAAAHEATGTDGAPMNIVHRDVSPQNILVGEDGRVRLADFGVARALHRLSSTQTGELRGKLGYFAPEQLRGQPASVRSDVFALGVVAWEAFAGRRLFRGTTPHHTVQLIRATEVPPLEALRDDVPPSLAACVERALARSPSARFCSARELAHALGESVDAASPSAIGTVVRELAAEELLLLDSKIRAALVEGPTTPRTERPLGRTQEPNTQPRDAFEIDDDTTTLFGAPTAELPVSGVGPTDTTNLEAPRPSPRTKWVVLALAGAVLGVAIGVGVEREPVPEQRPARPVASLPTPPSEHVDPPAPPTDPPIAPPAEVPSMALRPVAPHPRLTDSADAIALEGEPAAAEPEHAAEEAGSSERRRPEGSVMPTRPPRSGGLRSTEDFARALQAPR